MWNIAKRATWLVIAVALGVAACGPSNAVGQATSAGPPRPSSAGSGSGPAAANPPTLSRPFSSVVNGYSISYPGDWKVVTARETWPSGSANFNPDDRWVDSFSGPNLAIYAVSQKIAQGISPSHWIGKYMSDSELDFSNRPDCVVVKTQPIVVDGAAGMMNYSCSAVLIDAVVTAGGRAYVFSLQGDSLDKAWLIEVLKTVKLHPETAVDAASSGSPPTGP